MDDCSFQENIQGAYFLLREARRRLGDRPVVEVPAFMPYKIPLLQRSCNSARSIFLLRRRLMWYQYLIVAATVAVRTE